MFTFFYVLPYDVIRICSVGACANSAQVYWGQHSNNSPDDQHLNLLLYYTPVMFPPVLRA